MSKSDLALIGSDNRSRWQLSTGGPWLPLFPKALLLCSGTNERPRAPSFRFETSSRLSPPALYRRPTLILDDIPPCRTAGGSILASMSHPLIVNPRLARHSARLTQAPFGETKSTCSILRRSLSAILNKMDCQWTNRPRLFRMLPIVRNSFRFCAKTTSRMQTDLTGG